MVYRLASRYAGLSNIGEVSYLTGDRLTVFAVQLTADDVQLKREKNTLSGILRGC